ncbi:MAG: glycosyltransferase [Clostridia bacterium]|nr:glycosyltransferase [Clostridia bacterium]
MKISVYAISKNEEKFVERWVASMSEADEIYVADTGSTDNTVKLLQSKGVIVNQINIKPWRFDEARNKSLEFVSEDTDICVCTDLDEVFTPGWRKELEEKWTNDTTNASYKYIWNFDENGNPQTSFYIEKIHLRHNFKWIHPVHEVLKYTGTKEQKYITLNETVLKHYPDNTKSRGQYLPLLELSVKEESNDDRNMHYLGREYMFYKMYDKSIETLKKHLAMPSAKWRDERCASMRYIAKCHMAKKEYEKAEKWFENAIKEAPYLREPYIEYAQLEYELKRWSKVTELIESALKITNRPMTYISESYCWNYVPYDMLAIAYFNLGNYPLSLKNAVTAYFLESDNQRLKDNVEKIKEFVK